MWVGFSIPTLTGPEDAAKFVEDRIEEGSDFIKIVYDDGHGFGGSFPTLDAATLRAVIEAAHARELLAVVHISSQRQALEALEAGADGLAHLFSNEAPSEAFVAAAAERGVFVTGTLPVLHAMCDGTRGKALAGDPRLRPFIAPVDHGSLSRGWPRKVGTCAHPQAAVAQLHQAGVRLLASTDAPNPGTAHGVSIHDALALLVEAGLTPAAALRAATADPADVFGLERRGRIAPGKRADLLLVEGDPSADITATRAIKGVWKSGVVVDRAGHKDQVAAQWEEVERARSAPPPAGLAAGYISDFEGGELHQEFGAGWQSSTDAMRGGNSTVALEIVEEGIDGRYALEVKGTIDEGSLPNAWAGAIFFPGDYPMSPANLTSKPTLAFAARGDGPLVVMVFAAQLGMMPARTAVEIGPEWGKYTVDLTTLVEEPYDVTAIFFGGPTRAGDFSVMLDDIRLR